MPEQVKKLKEAGKRKEKELTDLLGNLNAKRCDRPSNAEKAGPLLLLRRRNIEFNYR